MATQNKIIEMIAAIKTIYSYYAKDTDVKLLVATWTRLLEGYDDELVNAAFCRCLQECKMPPTPADVIEHIKEILKAQEISDEELWMVYSKALAETARLMSQFDYTYVDATGVSQGTQARRAVERLWEGLPDKIKRYLASKGELMRNANEFNFDLSFASWEKQRFLKAMPIMEKREGFSKMLIGEGTNKPLIGGQKGELASDNGKTC